MLPCERIGLTDRRLLPMITDDLLALNRQLCEQLFRVPFIPHIPTALRPPALVFPLYRKGTARYSEQEARFLFCHLLHTLDLPYYYSVETPTDQTYQFTGDYPLSAQSDVSLYGWSGNDLERMANVEFKALQPRQNQIDKDISKLVSEPVPGNWFHTLKNADSGTLSALFRKLTEAFARLPRIATARNASILFCFCVIEKRWACIRQFQHSGSAESFSRHAADFFSLSLRVSRGRIHTDAETPWTIIQPD